MSRPTSAHPTAAKTQISSFRGLFVLCIALGLIGTGRLDGEVKSAASPAAASKPASVAGTSGPDDLVIADGGRTAAVAVVAPGLSRGSWEYRAAADLVKYIEMMSGAKPELADTREKIDSALQGDGPVLLVGSEALRVPARAAPACPGEGGREEAAHPRRCDCRTTRRQPRLSGRADGRRSLPCGLLPAPGLGLPLVSAQRVRRVHSRAADSAHWKAGLRARFSVRVSVRT